MNTRSLTPLGYIANPVIATTKIAPEKFFFSYPSFLRLHVGVHHTPRRMEIFSLLVVQVGGGGEEIPRLISRRVVCRIDGLLSGILFPPPPVYQSPAPFLRLYAWCLRKMSRMQEIHSFRKLSIFFYEMAQMLFYIEWLKYFFASVLLEEEVTVMFCLIFIILG